MAGGVVLRAFDWQGWDVTKVGKPINVKSQYLWMGKTTSKSNGTWEIELDGADFEEILSVNATVQVVGSNITDQTMATVQSVTVAKIAGTVVTANQSLLGGLVSLLFTGWKFSTTPQTVYVQVFGRAAK